MPEIMRTRRRQLQMSQKSLANLVGTTERQIGRWESGEREPSVSQAVKIADVLEISVQELVGGEDHRAEMAGTWYGTWQTWHDGTEQLHTQVIQIRQEGDFLTMVAERSPVPIEEGSYAWKGEARLWDNEILMGWYVAIDSAVRSKGTIYFKLHPHGLHASGRWVGLSHDGDVVTGFGAIARNAEASQAAVRGLIEQGGPLWTRSVT